MNQTSAKPQTVMVHNLANHNNMNHCYHKPQTVMVNNITSRIRKNAPKNNFDFDFKQTNTDTITKQYEPNLCQS
jgi:predicted small metal-binding protein